MRRAMWWLIAIVGAGIFAFIFYHAWQKTRPAPPPPPAPSATPPSTPAPPAEPAIRYPIPEQTQEKPLPALNESDGAVKEALGVLWDGGTLEQFFHLQDFIRRAVATVDNLPRAKVALRLMPVKPVPGAFLTMERDGGVVPNPANAARYVPYVKLADAVDAKKLVALYVHFYPLFQQAYQDLGYPKGYFNDRLVEVIDHLLGTPELRAPAKLVQPKVFHLYADPELEARSAGQKILMRVGNENAARLKSKLREIRAELTRYGPAQ